MIVFLCRLLIVLLLLSTTASASGTPKILVLGDSISAAYGMEVEQGWVWLLQQRLQAEGYPHRVINASISGETSGGGRGRLSELLNEHQPDLLILELGGNDGLRGLSLSRLQRNLQWMTDTAMASGSRVLLLGMRLPPNYGPQYTEAFAGIFPAVAEASEASVLPFMLEGIDEHGLAGMQADGIHPGPELQQLLLDNVWSRLEPLLARGQTATVSNP